MMLSSAKYLDASKTTMDSLLNEQMQKYEIESKPTVTPPSSAAPLGNLPSSAIWEFLNSSSTPSSTAAANGQSATPIHLPETTAAAAT
jgi:hypothetical protein